MIPCGNRAGDVPALDSTGRAGPYGVLLLQPCHSCPFPALIMPRRLQ